MAPPLLEEEAPRTMRDALRHRADDADGDELAVVEPLARPAPELARQRGDPPAPGAPRPWERAQVARVLAGAAGVTTSSTSHNIVSPDPPQRTTSLTLPREPQTWSRKDTLLARAKTRQVFCPEPTSLFPRPPRPCLVAESNYSVSKVSY